jgi:hypothetical protein
MKKKTEKEIVKEIGKSRRQNKPKDNKFFTNKNLESN